MRFRCGRGLGAGQVRCGSGRLGCGEIRVAGRLRDPAHGHSVQRSFTVHGDEVWAQRRRWRTGRGLLGSTGLGHLTSQGLNVVELLTWFMAGPGICGSRPRTPRTATSLTICMADSLCGRCLTLTRPARCGRRSCVGSRAVVGGHGVGPLAGRRARRSRGRSPRGCCVRTRWSGCAAHRGRGPGLITRSTRCTACSTLAEADVADGFRWGDGGGTPALMCWRRLLFSAEQAPAAGSGGR